MSRVPAKATRTMDHEYLARQATYPYALPGRPYERVEGVSRLKGSWRRREPAPAR